MQTEGAHKFVVVGQVLAREHGGVPQLGVDGDHGMSVLVHELLTQSQMEQAPHWLEHTVGIGFSLAVRHGFPDVIVGTQYEYMHMSAGAGHV